MCGYVVATGATTFAPACLPNSRTQIPVATKGPSVRHPQYIGTRYFPFDGNDYGVIVVGISAADYRVIGFEMSDATTVSLRKAMSDETYSCS